MSEKYFDTAIEINALGVPPAEIESRCWSIKTDAAGMVSFRKGLVLGKHFVNGEEVPSNFGTMLQDPMLKLGVKVSAVLDKAAKFGWGSS